MVPSREEIEEYIHSLDQWVSNSLHAATADIPSMQAIVNRIWYDLGRFGPPAIPLPGLGVFEVPPPPPPPEPAATWLERTGGWIVNHRWRALGLGLCIVVGSGLLVGYAGAKFTRSRSRPKNRNGTDRKDVAVILGADCLMGPPLVAELEARGFIVVATAATEEGIAELEVIGHGFVRGLVLDPTDPASIPAFLRNLQSALSLRFPLAVSGDPYYASPSQHPHIHTVISLLSIHAPPPPTPLENLALNSTYLTYLQQSHLTPLGVIQGLLPLMRVATGNGGRKKAHRRILVCVPVIASRVGVAWGAAEAMSTAATNKGVDVLRRELRESGQSKTCSVTVVEVGSVGTSFNGNSSVYDTGALSYMNDWSSNQRATYGAAFLGALEHSRVHPRSPENVKTVITRIANVVTTPVNSKFDPFHLLNPEKIAVGAGAYVYTIASMLPVPVQDFLVSIPSRLIQLRNAALAKEQPSPENQERRVTHPVVHESDEDLADALAPSESRRLVKPPPSSVDSSDIELDSSAPSLSRSHMESSWVSLVDKQD